MDSKKIRADLDELMELARPLVRYLREKYDPHTAIVVTSERAVLTGEIMGVPFEIED